MELNQEHLEDQISELEKGYVMSVIELIKIPVFKKAIERDILKAKEKLKSETDKKELEILNNRVKALEETIEKNITNKQGHEESLNNVEQILTEVYKLRK